MVDQLIQLEEKKEGIISKETKKYIFFMDFKAQMKEIKEKYLGFLFLPNISSDKTIEMRKEQINKYESKRSFISRLNNPLTILGIILIFIILTWAVFAPLITTYDFHKISVGDFDTKPDLPPDYEHIFGTTRLGIDVFSRLIWGARGSLFFSILIVSISAFLGIFFGLISGYNPGIIDNLIMRFCDIMMAFPSLILVILIAVMCNGNQFVISLSYAVLGFVGYTRLLRASVLAEREKTYVQAAKISGASNLKILYRHILPNTIAPIIVSVSFDIGGTILGLAGLSFLGYSFLSTIDWGTDLNVARLKIFSAPYAAIIPGIGVSMAVLGFMLVGDGLRDALDPRLHGRKGS